MFSKIIRKEDWKTTKWSGGETHELFISPSWGDYATRDFKFRISVATTNAEKSTFTKLPNVERVIGVLDGELLLKHKNHHTVKLLPTEIDRFSGDWETEAEGKVKDFNLMMKKGDGTFWLVDFEKSALVGSNGGRIRFFYVIRDRKSVV